MKSDQVRVGDERQTSSGGSKIVDFDLQEIGEQAEGAKDHKASHERCEAVGDADEEDVKDDELDSGSCFGGIRAGAGFGAATREGFSPDGALARAIKLGALS